MQTLRHSLIVIFSILVSHLAFHVAVANALNTSNEKGKIELRYTVNIFNTNLGEIHTTISKNQQRFRLDSVTKAEGAASLVMGGDVKQNCLFHAQENKIITERSSVEKLGRKSFKNNVAIDWQSRKINFQEGTVLDIPEGYIVDSCNFQFAAAYTDLDVLKNNTIYILDGKKSRIKGYVFKSESHEILKTAFGEFDTKKIVLERELNPEKSFIFWVAQEHPYFPLKMIDKRKKGSRIMTLKSFKEIVL